MNKTKEAPLNRFRCEFTAKSINEGLARIIVSAFAGQLDPRIDELADLKTAVSEAVTNAVVHGYRGRRGGVVVLAGEYYPDGRVVITVKDKGCGITDIKQAMEPLFTTDAEGERSGMGFTVMQSFTDKLRVSSRPGKGTTVRLEKKITIE